MLTVHHLNESRSHRILWLLEELELPYEVRRYARDARIRLAPPDLAAVSPWARRRRCSWRTGGCWSNPAPSSRPSSRGWAAAA